LRSAVRVPDERNSLAIDVDSRTVEVGSQGRFAPRIPDTPERRRLERQRRIREVVFGAQDGVLTTLGIVTGIGSATTDKATILLTGFLSLLVGAISMGVGEYLGNKAEREVVQNAIDFEQREMLDQPEAEFAEQIAYYRMKGFTDAEAQTIVERLAKNPDIWLHEMVRDEFGIDVREGHVAGPASAFGMAGSFAFGAAVPILPHVFANASVAVWWSLVLATGLLFSIGLIAGRLGGRNPIVKGCEIVVYGAVVFALSYLAGHYVPALFGHPAISVGG
jgi:VIT1/CCC1 family predicted Fe2+/Mn2+ transporter